MKEGKLPRAYDRYLDTVTKAELYISSMYFLKHSASLDSSSTIKIPLSVLNGNNKAGCSEWITSQALCTRDEKSCVVNVFLSYDFEIIMTCAVACLSCINAGEAWILDKKYEKAVAIFCRTLFFANLAKCLLEKACFPVDVPEIRGKTYDALIFYACARAQDAKYKNCTYNEIPLNMSQICGHYAFMIDCLTNAHILLNNSTNPQKSSGIAMVSCFMRMEYMSLVFNAMSINLKLKKDGNLKENDNLSMQINYTLASMYFAFHAINVSKAGGMIMEQHQEMRSKIGERIKHLTNKINDTKKTMRMTFGNDKKVASLENIAHNPLMYMSQIPAPLCMIEEDVSVIKEKMKSVYSTI